MDCVFDLILGMPLSHTHPSGQSSVETDDTLQGDGSSGSPLGATRSAVVTVAPGITEEIHSVAVVDFTACLWLVVVRNVDSGQRSSALVHAFDNGEGDADYSVPSGFGKVKFRPEVTLVSGNMVLSINNREAEDLEVQARPSAV